jgi:hypothetical protein
MYNLHSFFLGYTITFKMTETTTDRSAMNITFFTTQTAFYICKALARN